MAGNEDGLNLWELVNSLMTVATQKYHAFDANGHLRDIEEACEYGRLLISTSLEHNVISITALSNVSVFLETLFEQTGQLADLNEAIELIQRAVSLTPAGNPDRPGYINNLSNQLHSRYDQLGELDDLEEAVSLAREAIVLTPEDSLKQANYHNNLALKLGSRYERLGQLEDLEEALSFNRVAVLLTPEDEHYQRGTRLSNLGKQLHVQFGCHGKVEDLDEAIEATREACVLIPDDRTVKPGVMGNLGNMLGTRFGRFGNVSDLDGSITLARKALLMTPDGHPELAARLNNLGSKLDSKFNHSGQIQDLQEAITLTRQAIVLTSENNPDRAPWSVNLANLLQNRYERFGELLDLEEAIQSARKALILTPEGSIDRLRVVANLGVMIHHRFRRLDEIDDLKEAIAYTQQALSLSKDSNPSERAGVLNHLSAELRDRYERIGEVDDLEKSISLSRQSLSLTPEDSPRRIERLLNLGRQIDRRYERFHRLSDLEEAIVLSRKALLIIPKDSLERPSLLTTLGNHLEGQYERLQQFRDLEEAISLTQQALSLTTDDAAHRPEYLEYLSNKLAKKYQLFHELSDLQEAIALIRKSLSLTIRNSSTRPRLLNNLAMQLRLRYSILEHLEDEDEAITLLEEAVSVTPKGSVLESGFLNNLGVYLLQRYARNQVLKDLEEGIVLLKDAWKSHTAIPFYRLRAALTLVTILKIIHRTGEALAIIKEAIELLPTVNTRLLGNTDQTHVIQSFAGMASDGCALYFMEQGDEGDGRAAKALSLLEAGRGAIIGLALDDRLDFAELLSSYPAPAERFLKLRDLLKGQQSGSQSLENVKRSTDTISPFEIEKQYNSCLREIRSLPGQADFLMAPSVEKIRVSAVDSVIVCVNVSDVRSDAIIITPAAIQAFELPELAFARVKRFLEKRSSIFSFRERRQMGKNNALLKGFLTWLWNACVKRVLGFLGYLNQRSEKHLPRVHWIGTGPASSLPFHAAGDYSSSPLKTTMDYVISSYIPSIRALLQVQTRTLDRGQPSDQNHKLLIMSMATTPQEHDLPGTSQEVRIAKQVNQGKVVVTEESQANAKTALREMQYHDLFHFAGHGSSHPSDAEKNCIIFERFDESLHEIVQDPLSLGSLLGVDVQPATLAFLSACSTAENQVEALTDEVLHLASGFLVAGFANVVASQWSTDDAVCVELSKNFYENLNLESGKHIRTGDVPRALHKAIERIRETRADIPILWAVYTHIGV